MCSAIEQKLIHNANRVVVCGLSSTGMFMDGFQVWDIPCFLALGMWLALPECSRCAEIVLDKTRDIVSRGKRASGPAVGQIALPPGQSWTFSNQIAESDAFYISNNYDRGPAQKGAVVTTTRP